jgi:hypothetical protein
VSLRLEAVAFDVAEPSAVAAFWAELLGRKIVEDSFGALLCGDTTQVGVRFAASEAERRPQRLHLHLTSESLEHQEVTVGKALRLGAARVAIDTSSRHVVLADPGGNEFCVIEPDNTFLAGCAISAK